MLGITTTNARVGGFRKKSSSYDADAAAFFARVTAAGGTLSGTEMTATNQLVLDMKSAGVWTAMKAVYPMVGASAAACAQNLKSSSFTGTFNGGWAYASTGVLSNGTNAYMNSIFNPITQSQAQNNTFLSVYVRNNIGGGYDIGNASNLAGSSNPTYLISRYGTNLAYIGISDISFACNIGSNDSKAFWSGGTNSALTQILYKNGSSIKTATTSANAFANFDLYLGASNNVGTALFFTAKEYAFASISDGLSSIQASNFYTAVQAFQTTLSRQV